MYDCCYPVFKIMYQIQSNLCITITWGTKFLRRYKEDLCITAKTVNSGIWPLYKGRIIFHLITHDTGKNKSACIFNRNKKQCCDKTINYKQH